MLKGWRVESEGQLSLGTCQPTGYITALGACLFESLIHEIEARLLESFHGTFATEALLPCRKTKRFFQWARPNPGLIVLKDYFTYYQEWCNGTVNCIISETDQGLNLSSRVYFPCWRTEWYQALDPWGQARPEFSNLSI